MGGGNYDPEYWGYNDVWSSSDGVHWQKETENAQWHERIWFSSVVYGGVYVDDRRLVGKPL